MGFLPLLAGAERGLFHLNRLLPTPLNLRSPACRKQWSEVTLLNPSCCSSRRTGKEKKRGEEEQALCCLPLKPQEAEDERAKVSNCQNVILKVIFQAQSSPQCHLSSSKVGIEGTIKHRIFCKDRTANSKMEEMPAPKQAASQPFCQEICTVGCNCTEGSVPAPFLSRIQPG